MILYNVVDVADHVTGVNALSAMKSIGPVLHPSICDMWDGAIPKLLSYLEANANDFKAQAWEDLILRYRFDIFQRIFSEFSSNIWVNSIFCLNIKHFYNQNIIHKIEIFGL